MNKIFFLLLTISILGCTNKDKAQEQKPFIGEIKMFAGNFAPKGWAYCDGQIMDISENKSLFSIIGTLYGGNGKTTFVLPDLRGRVSLHKGSGSGLEYSYLGRKVGPFSVDERSNDSDSKKVKTQASLAVGYIIALEGVYPKKK